SSGALVPGENPVSTVTYVVTGLPQGATFNPDTLVLSWTPGYNQQGSFSVTIAATDNGDGTGKPLTTQTIVKLTVQPVNRAPQIVAIPDGIVSRSGALNVPVKAVDPDQDPLTLTALGLPAFGSFTDHGDG